MPNSTGSLEPLSSPSPSPPPPESNLNGGAGPGLDSDSELSDLTEEEQENDSRTNEDDSDEVHRPTRRGGRKKRGGIVPEPMWGWAKKPKEDDWEAEEEEEEEQAGPAKAMEEEEDDEDQDPASPPPPADDPADNTEGKGDAPEEQDGSKATTTAEVEDAEDDELLSEQDEEAAPEDELEDAPLIVPADEAPASDEEGEEEAQNPEDADADSPAPVGDIEEEDEEQVATPIAAKVATDATPTPLEVKALTPVIEPAVSPTAPVPSSIMAGSQVIAAPVPSSPSTSASGTPSPSRTPTPGPVSDREADEKAASRRGKSARTARTGRARPKRKVKHEPSDHEAEAEQAPAEADDRDAADDDLDLDEHDLDMESDLLPVHRAEALDVLAQIELKFAQLRERIYVEKMENLAWEEALVAESTHPEMHHLHTELSKRRDKRLELASKRRDYEISNVNKRRRLDEEAVWSWWQDTKHKLQDEMIAETNRKKRRLDRERRALDRPQPPRRIPGPPLHAPVTQTFREIVKSYPHDPSSSRESIHTHAKKQSAPLVYPGLSTLSPEEIMSDLDYLLQYHHQAPFNYPRPNMFPPNVMYGGLPPGPVPFDPFNMMVDPPVNRFVLSQPPGLPHMQGPPSNFVGSNMGPRPHPHAIVDGDLMGMGRPPSGAGLPGHVHPFPPGGMPMNLARRSPSPPSMQSFGNGHAPPNGSKPHGWMSTGLGVPGPSSIPPGEREPKRMNGDLHDLDMEKSLARERERQREREFEQLELERAHHMQQHAQRQGNHSHAHQHLHTQPIRAAHHHYHHHHRQHQHQVLHHHYTNGPGPNGPTVNGIGSSGAPPGSLSPRTQRELELRRPHSGAPTEMIDLNSSASSSKHILPPSGQWRAEDRDRDRPSSSDLSRERDRQQQPVMPSSLGSHERSGGPFVMTPSQAMQSNIPASPRSMPGPGPSNPPGSAVPSRRGSFSGMDEGGAPRPPSSASLGHPSMDSGHRHSGSTGSQIGNSGARHQGSPTMPPQPLRTPVMLSPTRATNGLRLPPPSSPTISSRAMRSPIRPLQTLPSPADSTSIIQQVPSPKSKARRQTPPPLTRSPLLREHPAQALPPQLNSASTIPRTSSPLTMFPPSQLPPPPNTVPSSLPPARLPPVQDKHSPSLTNAPKMNAVPIDGP